MSKAPSKKALAEAGRRKLEAFRRARAEGTGANKAKAVAAQHANSETASVQRGHPAAASDTAAAAAESTEDGTQAQQQDASAASAADTEQRAPWRLAEPARHVAEANSGTLAAVRPATWSAAPTGVPSAPKAEHAVTPLQGTVSGASPSAFLLPVPRLGQPTAARGPPLPTWLPPLKSLAAQSSTAHGTLAAAPQATGGSNLQLLLPDDATMLGATAAETPPVQPAVRSTAAGDHDTVASQADSRPADSAGGMLAGQSPRQPLSETAPMSPPPAEQEAAAKAAQRASFEASHSPFIALSRTTSGKASSISAAIESASVDDASASGGLDSRGPTGTLLAEAASHLSSHSIAGDDACPPSPSRPASAISSAAGCSASPSLPGASKQPWYAKLFAPQPAGDDSHFGDAASAVANTFHTPLPPEPNAAVLAGSPAAADAAGAMDPAQSNEDNGSSGTAAGVARDLGSALEAFMGSDDDDGPGQAAKPDMGTGQQSDGKAAAAIAEIPAQPSMLTLPSRSSGYAQLADGYLGAASTAEPKASTGSALGTLQPAPANSLTAGPNTAGARSAGGPSSSVAPADLRLGRPISFQDWAGEQQVQPGQEAASSAGSSPLHNQGSGAGYSSASRFGTSGRPQLQAPATSQPSQLWEHSLPSRSDHDQPASTSATSPASSSGRSALPAGHQRDAAQQRVQQVPALQPPWRPSDAMAEARLADMQPAASIDTSSMQMPDRASSAGTPASEHRRDSVTADSTRSAASESLLPPLPPPPPKHSASAALANGVSAWLAAPPTPQASAAAPADAEPQAPDRSTAFLRELAASGPASGGEGRTAAALREHIDQLTHEAFELRRGLTQQADLASTLAAENAALTEDFNQEKERSRKLEASLEQLHAEVTAQSLALQGLGAERDAARATAREAGDRAKVLAAEVVALEEARIATRAAELRASAAARDAGEQAQSSRAQAARLADEREALAAAVSSLQAEKQALRVKLRRAGGSMDAGATAPTAEAPPPEAPQPQPQPQPQPLADALPQQQAQTQPQPQPQTPIAQVAHPPIEHSNAATAAEPAAAAVPAQRADQRPPPLGAAAASTLAQPGAEGQPDGTLDPARHSRRIAAAAAAAMQAAQTATDQAAAAGPAVAVLQQLLPWRLEAGGQTGFTSTTAGGPPGGVPADEAARVAAQRQATALAAITRMVQHLAGDKRSCLAALEAQQAELSSARASARDAHRKLAATQQRLELAVGRSMLQHDHGGVNGTAPASAPAYPAQQLRASRPGSAQPHFSWLNNLASPSRKPRRALL